MRLLEKKTIQTLVATQRKSQIDEGIMLAQKIDKLRATLSELQNQHTTFIQSMSVEMENKTHDLQKEIEYKQQVIVELDKKIAEKNKPIELAWDKIDTAKQELQSERKEIDRLHKEIDTLQVSIEKERQKLNERIHANNIFEQELKNLAEITQHNLDESTKTLQNSKDYEKKIETASKKIAMTLKKRENEVAIRENDIRVQKQLLADEWKQIEVIKARLEDQRGTLERALKRLK